MERLCIGDEGCLTFEEKKSYDIFLGIYKYANGTPKEKILDKQKELIYKHSTLAYFIYNKKTHEGIILTGLSKKLLELCEKDFFKLGLDEIKRLKEDIDYIDKMNDPIAKHMEQTKISFV